MKHKITIDSHKEFEAAKLSEKEIKVIISNSSAKSHNALRRYAQIVANDFVNNNAEGILSINSVIHFQFWRCYYVPKNINHSLEDDDIPLYVRKEELEAIFIEHIERYLSPLEQL